MTNPQLYLAIGLPCLTIIAGLIVSLFQMGGIREDIREIRGDIKSIVGKLGAMDVAIAKLMNR
jgi:hypothetical protein